MIDEGGARESTGPNVTNILLTDRDFEVLMSLYENVVMTFSQVAGRHFAINKKPTTMNRLAKLESAGLIRRERIPKMRLGLDYHAVGVVFQITKLGISRLAARNPRVDFKPMPIRLHPYTLHHDLILVDLASRLKAWWPDAEVINGKHLFQSGLGSKGLEPDLVLQMPEAKARVAIELELSDKSESRYREIVLRYRMANEYSKVIYFVGRQFIRDVMTRVILNRPVGKGETPDTDKFEFFDAFEFLKASPEKATANDNTKPLTIGGTI